MADTARGLTGWKRGAVPASLMLSFLANDGEEILTMVRTVPASLARAPRWLPGFVRGVRVTQNEVNVAVALMGILYMAAAIDGYRSRGRGWLYQNVQLLFGLHGFIHIGFTLATRTYTSGVATSPTVVIPQWLWARRALSEAGVPNRSRPAHAASLVLPWLAASHGLATRLTRSWD